MARSTDHQRLYKEQVKHLYRLCSISIAATLVNSFLMIFTLRKVISHTVLINWLSGMFLVVLFQYVLQQIYNTRHVMKGEPNLWERWFFMSALLSGLFWGTSAVFLFPEGSTIHQFYMVLLTFGTIGAAVGAYAVIMETFLGYCFPAVIPLIIRLFLMGDQTHVTLGGVTLIAFLLLIFTAKAANSSAKKMVTFRAMDFNPISPVKKEDGVSYGADHGIKKKNISRPENGGEKERQKTAQRMRAFEMAKRELSPPKQEAAPRPQESGSSRDDKMTTIIPLLQNVVRDVNNLLTYIQGKASLILLDMDSDHPGYERLKSLEKSVQLGAGLTKNLMEIGKRLGVEIKTGNLNDLTRRHFQALEGNKARNSCHLEYQDEIWDIDADPEEIERSIK